MVSFKDGRPRARCGNCSRCGCTTIVIQAPEGRGQNVWGADRIVAYVSGWSCHFPVGLPTMIERYSDHAANERTFLAWVRTAIAIMAFGFLVEKFDLFLEIAAGSLGVRAPSVGGQLVGNVSGLLLIALGGATMVLAIIRFRKTARNIDSRDVRPDLGGRTDAMLAMLLVLLGAALFVYLSYTLISRF
jgi:putative membrane protein